MASAADPRSVQDKTVRVDVETDLLVVGAGIAGVEAAILAAKSGLSVHLVDENPIDPLLFGMDVPYHFGSRYGLEVANTRDLIQTIAANYEAAFEEGVEIDLASSVLGIYTKGPSLGWLPGNLALVETHGKIRIIRFSNAILATGCRDFCLAFPGWETPGVMGAAAATLLINRYAALKAKTAVVMGSGNEALFIVRQAQAVGIRVAAVIEAEASARGGADFMAEMVQRQVPVLLNVVPAGVESDIDGVTALKVEDRDGSAPRILACDTVINAIGSVPSIELLAAAGAQMRHDPGRGGFVPVLKTTFETTLPGVFAIGDCAGTSQLKSGDPDIARQEARFAVESIVSRRAADEMMPFDPAHSDRNRTAWIAALHSRMAETCVCQCEEVTADDIRSARSQRHVPVVAAPEGGLARLAKGGVLLQDQLKRVTRAGMGPCQGRRCREQISEMLADELKRDVSESGLASYRFPVRPIPLSVLAEDHESAGITENWVSWFGIPDQYKPHWDLAAPVPHARRPSVARGAEVVIIGGGVIGLSAAWWLLRNGIKVIVLEAGVIGSEASGRNGGGSGAFHSPLFPEAEALWPQMDELLGYPTEFRPGRLKIVRTEAQLSALKSSIYAAEHVGCRVERLDPRQLAELVPLAGVDGLGGVYFHGGGHMNPLRTLQAYAWAVEDLGGRILQQTGATGFRVRSGRIVEVETTSGSFACDAVVLAAGPNIGAMAAQLAEVVPVASARAEMVLTEPLPLMPFTNVDGNGLYGRQTLRGNLAYGGGPHEWLASAPAAGLPKSGSPLIRSIAKRVAELLPLASHARVIRSWAGFIECTPDGRPIIDRLASVDNAVVATMSSVGFGLSPAAGRAIMELLRDGRCDFADLGSFSLSRFADLSENWREERGWVAATPPGAIHELSV